MTCSRPSWFGRLVAGGELGAAEETVQCLTSERIETMNVRSIVSTSTQKGDLLNVNDKFVEASKYACHALIGAPHGTTHHPDIAATYEELRGQAEQLRLSVAVFSLGDSEGHGRRDRVGAHRAPDSPMRATFPAACAAYSAGKRAQPAGSAALPGTGTHGNSRAY